MHRTRTADIGTDTSSGERGTAMKSMTRVIKALVMALAMTIGTFGALTAFIVFDGDAPDLSYTSLDYNVTIQRDGSLRVVQQIDVRLRDRGDDADAAWHQLYQRYTLKESNLTNITDIAVTNADTGQEYHQGEYADPGFISDATWDTDYANRWYIGEVRNPGGSRESIEPYDPAKDGYHIPDDGLWAGGASKTVEIGWNIPTTKHASSMKFTVAMTLEGVSTEYQDVAAFQWEPIAPDNQTPAGKVTGTVRFPSGISASNSWAWLHNTNSSETSRDDDGTLHFAAYDLRAGDYLDLVAAWDKSTLAPPDGWSRNDEPWIRHDSSRDLASIRADEDQQETEWRSTQRTSAIIAIAFWTIVVVLAAIFAVLGILAAIRAFRASQYHGGIEYWREPPNMSPASAAKMAEVIALEPGKLQSRQLTSTLLSLASKGALAIYPGPASLYSGIDMSRADDRQLAAIIGADSSRQNATLDTMTLVLLPAAREPASRQALRLSASEENCLRLIEQLSQRVGSPVFDLRQVEVACKGWRTGYRWIESFSTACSNEFAMLGATRSSGGLASVLGGLLLTLGIVGAIVAAVVGNLVLNWLICAPIFALGMFILIYTVRDVLTDVGQRYAGEVRGLYRYLEDFSDFHDRGAADLALWDRYLVYAAAFGISDKAMVELAKAYPQVADPRWLDDNASGSLLYWNYRTYAWHHAYGSGSYGATGGSFGFDASTLSSNFGDLGGQLQSGFADITSTIQSAAPSGSGGSFSGGGFGGSSGGSGGGSFGGR